MAESSRRLVRRIQQALQHAGGRLVLPPDEVAELERRARRLRELDSCFDGVTLSSHVQPGGGQRRPVRGGSGLVGTEA